MSAVRWLLTATSLLLVLAFTLWDLRRAGAGPGPLHPAHAAVAVLDGGRNCSACHRSGAGVDAAACNGCHEAIGAETEARRGLHGSLDAEAVQRCERCHGDHHGDQVALIAPHAFARAGVDDPERYDHRHVEFRLTGAHAALGCERCHAAARAAAPPAGGRFLGLDQDCASCHLDAHRGAFGADCAACHGQERPWPEAPGLAHARFALQDAHAQVPCASCHAEGSPRDVVAEAQATLPTRGCAECHADPHGGATAAAATAILLPDTADCARCHRATRWADARADATAHAAYGFALRAAHASADCAACHGDGGRAPRWTGEAPALAACSACHASPHADALMSTATAAVGPANGCAGCHRDDDADFGAGRIDAAQHAATGFALAAPHADVACVTCHEGDERAERFPGRAAADCTACHADVHAGQFATDPRYAQCTACHRETQFVPHAFGVGAHAHTAFPLTGAHDAVACANCHRDVVDDVRRFHGTPTACASCHADVHRGTFDRSGRPHAVDGRTGCARCHDTAAFRPVAAGFDHGLWTGYRLEGPHAGAACAACHRMPSDGDGAPQVGQVPGTTCSACHADPHAGQFAAGGGTDCARCHAVTQWPELHFDHQRDSRFPLDATHAALPCSKCHVGYPVGDRTVVRFKPLGTTCGDCHRLGSDGKVRR